MAIPENNGIFDTALNKIIAPTTNSWSNLRSTIEIVISSTSDANISVANLIAGNVAFGNVTITNTTMSANSNVIVLGTTTANIANLSVGMRVWRSNIAGNVGNITAIQNSSTGVRWDTYKTWAGTPVPYLIYSTPIIDVGSIGYFNLEIDADITGNVKYEIRSSTTGTFDGSETLTNVFPATDNIPAFYGRYVVVTANVGYQGSLQTITGLSARNYTTPFSIYLNSISSSTLSGSTSSRQLTLGKVVSQVVNLQMTPHYYSGGSGYATNGYFTSGYIDETIITGAFPQIIDKTGGAANIVLLDNEGNAIDGTVDVLATVLPEQYMDGINLRQR
jgi:hypothetical protein